MNHRVFWFATRGQCIKGKKARLNTTTYFVLNCNVLALLSFYALPSGGNWKTRWSIDSYLKRYSKHGCFVTMIYYSTVVLTRNFSCVMYDTLSMIAQRILTHCVSASITVQLTSCFLFGFSCFVYVELDAYYLVSLNPNQSNRRSDLQWYFPLRSKWVFYDWCEPLWRYNGNFFSFKRVRTEQPNKKYKRWTYPASFLIYFRLFKHKLQLQINVKTSIQ